MRAWPVGIMAALLAATVGCPMNGDIITNITNEFDDLNLDFQADADLENHGDVDVDVSQENNGRGGGGKPGKRDDDDKDGKDDDKDGKDGKHDDDDDKDGKHHDDDDKDGRHDDDDDDKDKKHGNDDDDDDKDKKHDDGKSGPGFAAIDGPCFDLRSAPGVVIIVDPVVHGSDLLDGIVRDEVDLEIDGEPLTVGPRGVVGLVELGGNALEIGSGRDALDVDFSDLLLVDVAVDAVGLDPLLVVEYPDYRKVARVSSGGELAWAAGGHRRVILLAPGDYGGVQLTGNDLVVLGECGADGLPVARFDRLTISGNNVLVRGVAAVEIDVRGSGAALAFSAADVVTVRGSGAAVYRNLVADGRIEVSGPNALLLDNAIWR